MEIEKGKKSSPLKVVIYGPEGIGKSTLAARFPSPLFLDLEQGSCYLDVDRVSLGSYQGVVHTIAELVAGSEYRTLVIDTADALDNMVIRHVCQKAGKDGIEEFGYGKGYTYVKEEWCHLLDTLGDLQRKTGMNLVFCAHSVQRKVETPDAQNYDHYELKLAKQSAPLLKEWADFLLFLRYDILVDSNGKASGGERMICTNHTPYYDAKCRVELAPRLRLDDSGIARLFAAILPGNPLGREARQEPKPEQPKAEPQAKAQPKPEATAEQKPKQKPEPKQEVTAQLEAPVDRPNLNELYGLMAMYGITADDLNRVVVAKKMLPDGTPLANYSEAICGRLAANFEKISAWVKASK